MPLRNPRFAGTQVTLAFATVIRMIARLLTLVLFCLAVSFARAQGLVETHYDSGALEERFQVDADGQKHGTYEAFREDGTRATTAIYRADRLHGKFVELDAAERPRVEAMYANGTRTGFWREYESGVLRLAATYQKDVLDGSWERFDEQGRSVARGAYKRGALHGRFVEALPDEHWKSTLEYKSGKLHGRASISIAGKTVSKRKWEDDRLVDLDGIVPFPVAGDALEAELAEARVVPPSVDGDPRSGDRMFALARLRTYRALCGLRWRHIELNPVWNDLCDAAGEVCAAHGKLDHTPPKPPGFDEERYRAGYEGASHSNLSSGGLRRSVDAYMDDSDPSNIDRIGHRRWCLNPTMGATGFGASGQWAAMWAMDGNGPAPRDLDAVFYPARGYVPVDLFGPRHAWSIQLLTGAAPRDGAAYTVTVHRLDAHFQPAGDALTLDWKDLGGGEFGGGPCLVFRPVGVEVAPGARYRVRVHDRGAKVARFDYVVEFVAPPATVAGGD